MISIFLYLQVRVLEKCFILASILTHPGHSPKRRSLLNGLAGSESEPPIVSNIRHTRVRARTKQSARKVPMSNEANPMRMHQTRSKGMSHLTPLDEVSTVPDYDEMRQDENPSNVELKISQQINQFVEEDRGITQAYVFHVESGLTNTIFRFIRENKVLVEEYISQLNQRDAIKSQSTISDGSPTSDIFQSTQPTERNAADSSSNTSSSSATSPQPASQSTHMTHPQHIKVAMKVTGLSQSDLVTRYGKGELRIAGKKAKTKILKGQQRCTRCQKADAECLKVECDEFWSGRACIECRLHKSKCTFAAL